MIQQKIVWNAAMRSGLVLGGISIAYFLVNILMGKLPEGKAVAVLVNVSGILLWVAKIVACIWLFKHFMLKFSAANPDADNRDTFRFGNATALLSALLFSALYLAWVTLVNPDMFTESMETALQAYQGVFSSDQLDAMEEIAPKMPTFTFFANLVYCWLFGLVLSAIFSRNIPPRNPFNQQ